MLEWSFIGEFSIVLHFVSPFINLFITGYMSHRLPEYYLVSSTVPQDGEVRRSVAPRITQLTQLGPASQLLIHVFSCRRSIGFTIGFHNHGEGLY